MVRGHKLRWKTLRYALGRRLDYRRPSTRAKQQTIGLTNRTPGLDITWPLLINNAQRRKCHAR
eukprot:6198630-Lingulodinium_polyedra.AAC.1